MSFNYYECNIHFTNKTYWKNNQGLNASYECVGLYLLNNWATEKKERADRQNSVNDNQLLDRHQNKMNIGEFRFSTLSLAAQKLIYSHY